MGNDDIPKYSHAPWQGNAKKPVFAAMLCWSSFSLEPPSEPPRDGYQNVVKALITIIGDDDMSTFVSFLFVKKYQIGICLGEARLINTYSQSCCA
ncbi:hypothetical protein Tco_0921621 [Tanacetum coccineum]